MHWTQIAQRNAAGVVILDLHGQMTLSGEEDARLLRHIRAVVDAGYKHVLLNLASVSYVDSTGIGEIVGAYTRVVRHGGMLRLCNVSLRVQELLDAANVSAVVQSFATEAAALESF
jgi:anti-sigma B factor antagonist